MPRGRALAGWLAESRGLARTSQAYAAGFAKRDVAEAVASFGVSRVRRTWLTTRAPDDPLRRAVAAGGRLTCVSEARRRGLWTPDDSNLHVWLPASASRYDATGLRVHRGVGPQPVSAASPVEPLVNVLFHIAGCLTREHALAVWESAARHTELTADMLQQIPWRSVRARELAAAASVLSDSGLETHFVDRLGPFGLRLRQQVWIDGHPVDVLVGERLVVQLDGAHHLDPAQRRRDIRADARLAAMGYTVLRFDYAQVMFDWPYVESTVLMHVAQGHHRAA